MPEASAEEVYVDDKVDELVEHGLRNVLDTLCPFRLFLRIMVGPNDSCCGFSRSQGTLNAFEITEKSFEHPDTMADILKTVLKFSCDCCGLEMSEEGINILFTKHLECMNMWMPLAEKREKISQTMCRPIERFRYPASSQLRGNIPLCRRTKHFWHAVKFDVRAVPMRFICQSRDISCVPSIFGKLCLKQRRGRKSRCPIDQSKGVLFHAYLFSCDVCARPTATSWPDPTSWSKFATLGWGSPTRTCRGFLSLFIRPKPRPREPDSGSG